MQNIGAAWMMTELVASPLMVALVQTAMALPAFVLGLPSGVIADLMDKRLLLITQGLALLTMVLLCIPALAGNLGPVALLAYTFALGSASALSRSAWMACTIEHAPPGQVAAAIALGTVSPNIARVSARRWQAHSSPGSARHFYSCWSVPAWPASSPC